MIHYNKFIQIVQQQDIILQDCLEEQSTSDDPILAYRATRKSKNIIEHELRLQEQKMYVFVESGAECTLHVGDVTLDLHVVLLQDAKFSMNFSFMNAVNINCSINIYLEGDRAQVDIQGLYALDGDQKVAIQTYQYHAGVDTQSNLVVKGMLTGKAQASYHGLIKIDEFAKRADASQAHKNITLSKQARVISVPTIEVLQYDVQCCHGSAIGKFDQADMWYLQSKGIVESAAQALLVRSFFCDVLTESNNRDEIMDVLCQKMK